MKNALSIDIEDWFCVYNLSDVISREDWESCESRVVLNTRRLLDLLEENNVRATFFILGWIGEHFPEIIREIDKRKHEIGTHGYSHSLLTSLDRNEFEKLKDEYYELRGWERETGLQTMECMAYLGMDDIAGELDDMGLLG